jgi:uncharacterized protein
MGQLISKVVLGTVQFGIKYGINHISTPSTAEAHQILQAAADIGISELDTAGAYGNALEVLADFNKSGSPKFKIMTKVILESDSFFENLKIDLKRLGVSQLLGCYIHRFEDMQHAHLWAQANRAKEEKLIEKFAVSLYSVEQLECVINNPEIDAIQIPFNFFDQDKNKKKLLMKARRNGKLIYARSVFLQGLFFMSPEALPENLKLLSAPLVKLQKLASVYKIDLQALCLKYALDEECIDKVIIGVETKQQLFDNLKALSLEIPAELRKELEELDIENKRLVNPLFWK